MVTGLLLVSCEESTELPTESLDWQRESSRDIRIVLEGCVQAEGAELVVEEAVAGLFELGIVGEDLLAQFAGFRQCRGVLRQVGDVQVEGQTALARAFEVAGTAHPQVGLGQFKAVAGSAHQLDALPRLAAELVARHQDAVGRSVQHFQ